ncbi:IclR family transcriptional regulator C-terminal domain-containing protein [Amycolatopsis sp. ATCC 39116]|uniref:IclR family transcriptional regulator domain-containing protein n=1 Tax=Amycolatopsis sp. (strain ATCC 39116 / 75iv2) TaxID=385957 RepID=UPI00026280F1|nr:IclR family transcriptional regulator C-terminal domain-containing protein [Amycolatopsis sp. ATCC 39116]
MAEDRAEPEVLASVERGLAVLRAFRPEQTAMTLSEVAKASGLDRASARRFLHTLLARAYLRADGQQFRLHPSVLELGNAYLEALRLPRIALPHLRSLSARFNEPVSMAVLDGDQAVHVAHVPSNRLMAAIATIGSAAPAHRSALGRALLAGKPDEWLDGYLAAGRSGTPDDQPDPATLRADIATVRRTGWLTTGSEAGVRSIAAPVRDTTSTIVAAIGISSHADRVSESTLVDTMRPALLEAVDHIQQAYTRGEDDADRP